jgi:hypothetical protein
MYDGRMQAQRLLHITADHTGITFEVKKEGSAELPEKQKTSSAGKKTENTVPAEEKEEERENATSETKDENEPEKNIEKRTKDPLRMFGYSTPSTLKSAQTSAIEMVENSISQICAINSQMMEVEIQIRRARKQRVKAEEREKESAEGVGVVIEV